MYGLDLGEWGNQQARNKRVEKVSWEGGREIRERRFSDTLLSLIQCGSEVIKKSKEMFG